jgi:hypothetical protein
MELSLFPEGRNLYCGFRGWVGSLRITCTRLIASDLYMLIHVVWDTPNLLHTLVILLSFFLDTLEQFPNQQVIEKLTRDYITEA